MALSVGPNDLLLFKPNNSIIQIQSLPVIDDSGPLVILSEFGEFTYYRWITVQFPLKAVIIFFTLLWINTHFSMIHQAC